VVNSAIPYSTNTWLLANKIQCRNQADIYRAGSYTNDHNLLETVKTEETEWFTNSGICNKKHFSYQRNFS
jgi:hypothetical protein